MDLEQDVSASGVLDELVDQFGPVTQPIMNYIRLPDSVSVHWIGSEDDVGKLACLLDEPFVGVDSEWRMDLLPDAAINLPLLQISGVKDAFLIDMLKLGQSEALDDILKQIFNSDQVTILGFSFHSDLSEFARRIPKMTFYRTVANFVDIQTYYHDLHGVNAKSNAIGLLRVAEHLFGKSICK